MTSDPFISSDGIVALQQVIQDDFPIIDYVVDWGNEIVRFQVQITPEQKSKISKIMKSIRKMGYLSVVRPYYHEYSHTLIEGQYWLLVGKYLPNKKKSPKWNIILFLATIGTVSLAGYNLTLSEVFIFFFEITNPWPTVILFTIALIGILGTHELGHMIASKYHGLPTDLPYFIPVPPLPFVLNIGTFGALIRQEEPFMDKNVLFDVGIAGPILGLITTIIVTMIGYILSVEIPMSLSEFLALYPNTSEIPSPILSVFIGMFFTTNSSGVILVHPVGFAGWVGFFLTALQLLPASQLDGGHVAYAVLGQKYHRIITYVTIGVMFILNLWLMALLLLVLSAGQSHPETLDSLTPLSTKRKILAVSIIPLLILTMPPLFAL